MKQYLNEKQLNWFFTKWSLSGGVRLREVVAVRPVKELTVQTPSIFKESYSPPKVKYPEMNAVMSAVMCLKFDNEQQVELKKGLLRISSGG